MKIWRINEKMREEIKKMEQAVASSSSFIKNLKGEDLQQAALNKAISNFWDISNVPPVPAPTNIASYPSIENLDEERKEELTEAQYEYYNLKRAVLIEKMTVANEIHLAHLQNYKQQDPKKRSQKYLIQFNELIDKLNQQFETAVAMLNLPFEKSLMTYPSLGYIMDIVQQEDLSDKNREFFQELMREVEIKNAIAQKILNRLAVVGNSEEEAEVDLQHKEYQKESFRLLRFCRRMIEKKDKEAGYIEFDQLEGVPDVEPITEKELDQRLREALIEPQQVKLIGDNTIPPHYSREMSRYEPPKEKGKQEALEKVKELTNGGSKGSKSEKQVEGDTDLSWDHEGLEPHVEPSTPKPPRSPKPSRVPRPGAKDEQTPVKTCPKCRGNHDEKDPKSLCKEGRKKGGYTSSTSETKPPNR